VKWINYIWFAILLLLLPSCDSLTRDGARLQKTLHAQQQHAEDLLLHVIEALDTHNFDSLVHYTHTEDDVMLYVYRGQQLVYWTDSWLTSPRYPLRNVYDVWQFAYWGNAWGICKRVRAGDVLIIAAIPIKYNYQVTSENLHNTFILPFKGDEQWHLSLRQDHTGANYPIYSYTGEYLFSVVASANIAPHNKVRIENFSYQAILASEKHDHVTRNKIYVYYGFAILVVGALLVFALVRIIKSRGVQRLSLAGRLQLVLTPVMMLVLVSIFLLSVIHIREVFVARQRDNLQEKAKYIQQALQNMYYWDLGLSPANSNALNIDLRDISFVFETDIHVYDLNGQLLGSSTPQIFDYGIVSHSIAPEAFFTDDPTLVQYEQIGDVRYLSAYTEFVNGSFTRIGYIAVPSFISQSEMNTDVEEFMMRILPLYIILLLLSILVVWLFARGVSAPLRAITLQLKNYRLGGKSKHISYGYHDEVGDLLRHYNLMMDALSESIDKLARSEREGAWRTMARQVAHEINNPLTAMKLTLQQLQRRKGSEQFDDYFDRSTKLLIEQIDNLGAIATSFSSFVKMPDVKPVAMDIAAKLSAFITLLKNNSSNIPIRYIGPENGKMVMADAEQITQVFTNIARNAIQAMNGQENGDLIIILKAVLNDQRTLLGLAEDAEWVEISFSDNGPGIPKDIQDKVFIPNFTTKNTGAGLGLAISKNIVEGSGGKITFRSSEKGTIFFVYLRKK
jgi:signal transduction histidine kinase